MNEYVTAVLSTKLYVCSSVRPSVCLLAVSIRLFLLLIGTCANKDGQSLTVDVLFITLTIRCNLVYSMSVYHGKKTLQVPLPATFEPLIRVRVQ